MSFSTIAAARQNEIKLSIAVVATKTLATGRTPLDVVVSRGSGVMYPPEGEQADPFFELGGPFFLFIHGLTPRSDSGPLRAATKLRT